MNQDKYRDYLCAQAKQHGPDVSRWPRRVKRRLARYEITANRSKK